MYSRATLLKKLKKSQSGGSKTKTIKHTETLKKGEDTHVSYQEGRQGQAILEDPLIQAYFHRRNEKIITPDSEIPVGLAMAVYGNHAQLGSSGLSKKLPNVLSNPELQEYWTEKGVQNVTPQTMIPVKYIFLNQL